MDALPETQETRECGLDELDQIRENLLQIEHAVSVALRSCEKAMRKHSCELPPWVRAGMSKRAYEHGQNLLVPEEKLPTDQAT